MNMILKPNDTAYMIHPSKSIKMQHSTVQL